MESYGGFRVERTLAQDGSLRAHGCVLSVREEPAGNELFRVAAWVTDHLGRRAMTGQGTTELAVMFASESARAMIDGGNFERGTLYREVHRFDPMRGTETIARDRVSMGLDPEPTLPTT
jgi:hypothetical protein